MVVDERETRSELLSPTGRVVMLSGDSAGNVAAVARSLGIDEAIGEVLPEDKAKHVKRLQAEGRQVAMAGDGINDAPALAQADVGIAMGTGTDIAMESAGVTLVQGDLRGVLRAIELSRATMRNIRQNLGFAFGYNALGAPRNPEIPANADPTYFDLGLCGPYRTDLASHAEYCGKFRTPSLRNAARRRNPGTTAGHSRPHIDRSFSIRQHGQPEWQLQRLKKLSIPASPRRSGIGRPVSLPTGSRFPISRT